MIAGLIGTHAHRKASGRATQLMSHRESYSITAMNWGRWISLAIARRRNWRQQLFQATGCLVARSNQSLPSRVVWVLVSHY
jgi:hypothetical protein